MLTSWSKMQSLASGSIWLHDLLGGWFLRARPDYLQGPFTTEASSLSSVTVKVQEDLLATSCKMRPTGWENRGTCTQMCVRVCALPHTNTSTPPSISLDRTQIVPLHRVIMLEKLQGVPRPGMGHWEVWWLGKIEKNELFSSLEM